MARPWLLNMCIGRPSLLHASVWALFPLSKQRAHDVFSGVSPCYFADSHILKSYLELVVFVRIAARIVLGAVLVV